MALRTVAFLSNVLCQILFTRDAVGRPEDRPVVKLVKNLQGRYFSGLNRADRFSLLQRAVVPSQGKHQLNLPSSIYSFFEGKRFIFGTRWTGGGFLSRSLEADAERQSFRRHGLCGRHGSRGITARLGTDGDRPNHAQRLVRDVYEHVRARPVEG